jgi:hypothetical protein
MISMVSYGEYNIISSLFLEDAEQQSQLSRAIEG